MPSPFLQRAEDVRRRVIGSEAPGGFSTPEEATSARRPGVFSSIGRIARSSLTGGAIPADLRPSLPEVSEGSLSPEQAARLGELDQLERALFFSENPQEFSKLSKNEFDRLFGGAGGAGGAEIRTVGDRLIAVQPDAAGNPEATELLRVPGTTEGTKLLDRRNAARTKFRQASDRVTQLLDAGADAETLGRARQALSDAKTDLDDSQKLLERRQQGLTTQRTQVLDPKNEAEIEKGLIEAGDSRSELDRISAMWRPEFNTLIGRLKTAKVGLQEFLQGVPVVGGPVNEEERVAASQMITARTAIADSLNKYIKRITGAQMSEAEAKRLGNAFPKPEDDPLTFQSKLEFRLRDLDYTIARQKVWEEIGGTSKPFELLNGQVNEHILGEADAMVDELRQKAPTLSDRQLFQVAIERLSKRFAVREQTMLAIIRGEFGGI